MLAKTFVNLSNRRPATLSSKSLNYLQNEDSDKLSADLSTQIQSIHKPVQNISLETPQFPALDFERLHRTLAKFNHGRLSPRLPSQNGSSGFDEVGMLVRERTMLSTERTAAAALAGDVPNDAHEFVEWFVSLEKSGPGQHDPLFDWLESEADTEQMKWFVEQEVAGEAGFDDLVALTQIKFPTQAKLEMARNYWDEMGRGKEISMHGPMLESLASEMNVASGNQDRVVPESIALANILLGMAVNRDYAYHSVGALGVIELTAPGRAKKVHAGLKRLGLSATGQRYFLLHSTVDIKHSADWNTEVIFSLVRENSEVAQALAEGALMRLKAGERCFLRYKQQLKLNL